MPSCWLLPLLPAQLSSLIPQSAPSSLASSDNQSNGDKTLGSHQFWAFPSHFHMTHLEKYLLLYYQMNSIIPSLGLVIPFSLTLYSVFPGFMHISITLHPDDLFTGLHLTDFELFDGKTCIWPSLLHGACYRTWQKENVLDSVTGEWICSLRVWPHLLTDGEPSSLTAEEFCTLLSPQFWNSGQVCEEALSPLDRNPHLDHIPLPQISINNSGGNKLTFWTWAQAEESKSK